MLQGPAVAARGGAVETDDVPLRCDVGEGGVRGVQTEGLIEILDQEGALEDPGDRTFRRAADPPGQPVRLRRPARGRIGRRGSPLLRDERHPSAGAAAQVSDTADRVLPAADQHRFQEFSERRFHRLLQAARHIEPVPHDTTRL